MLEELLGAFVLVFVAEIGDKSQILAMMFATRYKPRSVLLGVLIGAILNHGLAVLLGATLGHMLPVETLTFIAGLVFLYFAYVSLEEEDEDAETGITNYKNIIMTVALAFFIGELGDKTQLTAITLAMDASSPLVVLLGTVSAMVVTSSIGIWIGSRIGPKISKVWIKITSTLLFLICAFAKLIPILRYEMRGGYLLTGATFLVFIFALKILRFMKYNKIKRRFKK